MRLNTSLTNMAQHHATIAKQRLTDCAAPPVQEANRAPDATILTLTAYYVPSYKAGGPTRSIENMVAELGRDFRFRIVTTDRDAFEKEPFPGIVPSRWMRIGDADVMYLSPGFRGVLDLCALLLSVDRNTVLYLNSFFCRQFSMLAMLIRWLKLCRPRMVVLAPRGEFSPGALRLKRRRKLLYARISRWLGIYDSIIWHASSEFEADDIRRQFPSTKLIDVASPIPKLTGETPVWNENNPALDEIEVFDADGGRTRSVIATASDIPKFVTEVRSKQPKRTGQLRAVFLSRLARKKNLAGALRVLEGVSGEVSFDIYGPLEDPRYWHECQSLIAALPPNIRVRYFGEAEHHKISSIFAQHELFLFPTLGENYGHVISEALASGCLVLMSDQTPWRNLEAEGVGWDIPLSEIERFRSALQQCVDGDDVWFRPMSKRAIEFAVKRASAPETIRANREIFQKAFSWPNGH